jgi:hypothetical protein
LDSKLTVERTGVAPAVSFHAELTGLIDEVACTSTDKKPTANTPDRFIYVRDSQLFIPQSDKIGKPTAIETSRR